MSTPDNPPDTAAAALAPVPFQPVQLEPDPALFLDSAVVPAADTVAVTDDEGPKVLATHPFLDRFIVPTPGDDPNIVLTPAGTAVDADEVTRVRDAAAYSGVALLEVRAGVEHAEKALAAARRAQVVQQASSAASVAAAEQRLASAQRSQPRAD